MEAVKGLQGWWHYTNGEWDKTGNKLKTLCGKSISPNFRIITELDAKRGVNCPKCRILPRER
jgi:DNA-directed RNA polymerase subunit RPC12/RpoP